VSFLAPLFLLGALAVGLPILFHLIRQTSRERQRFSSLMFLRPSPPRLTRRSRLEDLLLLLLRGAILVLLAAAFARPFFNQPLPIVPQVAPREQTVLLVDTSASMRRDGLWTAALESVEAFLRRSGPENEVALFTFDRQVRSLMSFEQWQATPVTERLALTQQRLAEATPGWAVTYLGDALITGAEALVEADRGAVHPTLRRIVVVSDLQEGSRLEGLEGYNWPKGLEVVVEPLKAKRPTNAGLQWVLDAGDVAPATNSGPRVRVSNSADARQERFQLRWQNVTGAEPIEVYVPPGQSRVSPAPPLPTGTSGECLALSGDDDAFDNTAWRATVKAEDWTVLYLGNDAEADPAQPLYFLKRALQGGPRRTITLTAKPANAPLAATELADARIVIVATSPSATALGLIQECLNGGGTVLWVLRAGGSVEALAGLAGANGLTADDAVGSDYAMLSAIDFAHPLFASFADPRYSDFTRIHFWKHRRLDVARLPNARVPARFDNGDPALIEIPKGQGRLLVLTAGWHPADSQLALSSKFVPLLHAMLEQAGPRNTAPTAYRVGDPVTLPAPPDGQAWVLLKPDGVERRLTTDETRFAETDLPGIYGLSSGDSRWRFAVNLDAAESRTAPRSLDDLERLGVPLKPVARPTTSSLRPAPQRHQAELEARQKLWRWLLLGAAGVMIGEIVLAGRVTRQRAMQTQP
jgi:hypothetical protein